MPKNKLPVFPMWVADYLSDTSHLDATEHGVYHLLLYRYWLTDGRPLPENTALLRKIARCRTFAKVASILNEFWTLEPGIGWHHERARIELRVTRDRKMAARESAKKRWENNDDGYANASNPQCSPSPSPSPEKRREDLRPPLLDPPIAKSPTPETPPEASGSPSKKGSPTKLGTRLPEDWEPSPELVAWAQAERPDLDVAKVAAEFVDYWVPLPGARGRKLDWSRTFKNRIRSAPAPRNGVPFREGIEQKAESIGLSARPGETWEQFRHRVERAKR